MSVFHKKIIKLLIFNNFIVVVIGHSHQTVFSARNETKAVFYPQVVPLESKAEESKQKIIFDAFLQTKDTLKHTRLFYEHIRIKTSINRYLDFWAQDISAVLDKILTENRQMNSFLYQKIDTARVGAFGMSFGRAASGEMALRDARIKAGLNMDGTQYGNWVNDTLKVPFAFLEAECSPYGYSMYAPLKYRTKSDLYFLMFKNANHWNFTDVNLYSPLFQWIGTFG